MTRRSFVLLLLLLCAFFLTSAQQPAKPAADLVIQHAKVVTIDPHKPQAEAIAVAGEKILAVGSDSEIAAYIQPGRTTVVDANGRLVIPGFNDTHAHFGPIDPDYIELRYITDPGAITRAVAGKVKNSKPGELIRGGHWEHEMFRDKKWPTKELIDLVAPDNPVALSRADGHSVLVNSYVIKASGITRDTPDPFGGEIQKDPATGEPTGIFKETAQRLLKYNATTVQRTAEEEEARRVKGWQMAFEMAASLGVTSIQHAGEGFGGVYQKLLDEGKLTARLDVDGRLTDDPMQLKQWEALRARYPREGNWIRFGYLKGFIDGTLGSGTALFFEPFVDEPSKSGLAMMPYEELERKVVVADKMGFQIGIHAIGSKGNHWILNAYEKARSVNGRRDSRHRSEHAQILTDQDIPRFAQLGVIASMQPTHCITDKRFCEKRIGKERSRGAYAWRRLLNAGTRVAFGTDYSVEPLNPMEGLYASVTRKDRLGEPGDGWFPDQKLSMEEAIRLYTHESAYAQFMEDRKGMLRKDYLADIVIMHDDLMIIPPEKIMQAKVDFTIVGGKVVFRRAAAKP
ncbi:MAG: amidohydrolase [Acidobacteria bacterium]|nr:MAG: amidohydrolase [Acidobacteriota bacterium]